MNTIVSTFWFSHVPHLCYFCQLSINIFIVFFKPEVTCFFFGHFRSLKCNHCTLGCLKRRKNAPKIISSVLRMMNEISKPWKLQRMISAFNISGKPEVTFDHFCSPPVLENMINLLFVTVYRPLKSKSRRSIAHLHWIKRQKSHRIQSFQPADAKMNMTVALQLD